MILRRLAQQLREQNWIAIFIEFVLLVLGVFLGIQAANWNEARVERELVRGHLSEIAQDLRRHLDFAEDLESSARMRIAAVDWVYQQAFGRRLPTRLVLAKVTWEAPQVHPFPAEQLDHLMGSVNLVRVSVRSRQGYESLISSGRLALLTNRELARQIQTYYGNYDDLLDTQTNVFRSFRNTGAIDQYAIGLSVFDERPPAEIVALARDNPGFATYLRSQREWAILHYNLLDNIDEQTKSLLSAIEVELAQP